MAYKAIIEFFDCQQDCLEFSYNKVRNYEIVCKLKAGDDRNKILESIEYDTVIMLSNSSINYLFAYNLAKKYIQMRKNIIVYYVFTNEDMVNLNELANRERVSITFNSTTYIQRELCPINIPVMYITGMGINCDQLDMHLKLSSLLKRKNMKVLNYSNSIYSNLFDFINLKKISNTSFADVITLANQSITDKIFEEKPDVIIISDVGGIQPYNAVINNNYGIYNSILKYACPYDYVFYNIYATEYDPITLNEIINKVICTVNKNTLCIGLGHTAPTMAIAGLSDNDDFIEVISEEYNRLVNNLKNITKFDVVNPRLEEDLETYINKLISS